MSGGPDPRAARLIARLADAGSTVATAESVTGGLVAAELTTVPGSSAVVRGAVVAYATDLKVALLGVDRSLLDRAGPVQPEVAEQMAVGVAARLGATYGVATTGEAGPESASGAPVGTVHVAVAGPHGSRSAALRASGTRSVVRAQAVRAALTLLEDALGSGD